MRLTWVGIMLAIYTHSQNQVPLHLAMLAILTYPFIHFWKGEFHYRIVERIVFSLGELAFILNYFLFKYAPSLVAEHHVDFVLLTIVLGIDFGLYSVRVVQVCCYGLREKKEEVEMEDEIHVGSHRSAENGQEEAR